MLGFLCLLFANRLSNVNKTWRKLPAARRRSNYDLIANSMDTFGYR